MQQRENIAARAGRWSARHRRKAILGWLAFVIASLAIGGALGVQTLSDEDSGVGESGRAEQTLHEAFPQKTRESVIVQSDSARATDPSFRAAVDDTVRRLEGARDVRAVQSPYADPSRISEDGRSALIELEIAGDPDTATDRIDPALAATAAAAKAHPELTIEQFGDASADKAIGERFDDDFKKAELTSLPITLIVLVLAFGALVAAGVPLLLALSGVAATIGLLGPVSQIAPVDESVNSVILLIGLAVGVDYSLFYLRREREERAAGRSEQAALEAAAATSGRAVLISGFTVMIAMAGMYLAGASTFESFATGTILVVAVSVVGSLTVLPAILSKLGDRVEKGRVPLVARVKARAASSGIWSRTVDRVLARPLRSALVAGGLLVALALPALAMETSVPGADGLPRDLAIVDTYDRIQAAFPGESIPADVVVKAEDVTSGATAAAIDDLQRRAAEQPELFERGAAVEVSPDETVAKVSIPIAGDGTDARSNEALDTLRGELIPATIGTVDGATADVTGMTAGTADFNESMSTHVPWVFAFVLTAAFVLLMVTFRSVVIPLKAIVLNLLSVGAAYGLLVLVFQEGWGEGLLGFESTGAITAWLPLFLFVVLFGLSMDYHVFILTRIKEAVDRGMRTDRAVALGLESTAGVVTAAAVVMVAVFSIFATLSAIEFKQMGVGLAAAILIDATIIRGVLLPATMKLLGEWNWWLPSWLEWLPRVEPEAAAGVEPEPVPAS